MSGAAAEVTRLVVLEESRREEAGVEYRELLLYVPPELRWFRGHFDGNPVLPAVVQVHEVLSLVVAAWPDLKTARAMTKLKFRSPIRPAEKILARLRRTPGATRANFELLRGDLACASGTIEYAP